jgi:hypothetical protein
MTACAVLLVALVAIVIAGGASAGDGRPEPGLPRSPEAAASKDIDVDTLADDLGSSDAIDFITKLNLRSELDNLVAAFREYHDGSDRHDLPALYGRFDRLLDTTLALVEGDDPMLYRRLKRSRTKLWHILADREAFLVSTDDPDVALLKDPSRH